jgi:hypothetical protein
MTDQQPRLVDTGNDSFEVVDPDGNISVRILTTPKDINDQYRIRYYHSTQEIYDQTGKTVARTSDPEMAEHIRKLLVVWERLKEKQKPAE